jgi:uncharacterized RDD family membrane protein YckC
MTDTWTRDQPGDFGKASGPRAGFWLRFGAWLIDSFIVGATSEILDVLLHRALGSVLSLVLSIGYYVYFEGGPRGGALGKQFMNIRVVDANTGYPIGYPRAFVRWISHILSALAFLLGYLWFFWDSENQCWHDKLAGDVVVPTSAYPVQQASWS